MFAFVPKTDLEIQNVQNRALLTDGVYPFLVKDVKITISKSGNEMLEVQLNVIDREANGRSIRDYLMATDTMIFKLKHFCDTIGMSEDYAKGNINPFKCVGRSGKVIIATQKGNAKDDGSGYYPDKNTVKDYVKQEAVQKEEKAPFIDDDIKF